MAVEKIVKIIGGKCWVEIVLFLTCPPTQDHRWQKYNKVKFDFTSSTECSSTELRHFPSRLNPTMYVVCVVLVTWTLSNLQVFRPSESDIFGWQKSESIKMLASFERSSRPDSRCYFTSCSAFTKSWFTSIAICQHAPLKTWRAALCGSFWISNQ